MLLLHENLCLVVTSLCLSENHEVVDEYCSIHVLSLCYDIE